MSLNYISSNKKKERERKKFICLDSIPNVKKYNIFVLKKIKFPKLEFNSMKQTHTHTKS